MSGSKANGSQSVLACMGDGVLPFRNAKIVGCDVNGTGMAVWKSVVKPEFAICADLSLSFPQSKA